MNQRHDSTVHDSDGCESDTSDTQDCGAELPPTAPVGAMVIAVADWSGSDARNTTQLSIKAGDWMEVLDNMYEGYVLPGASLKNSPTIQR